MFTTVNIASGPPPDADDVLRGRGQLHLGTWVRAQGPPPGSTRRDPRPRFRGTHAVTNKEVCITLSSVPAHPLDHVGLIDPIDVADVSDFIGFMEPGNQAGVRCDPGNERN